MPTNPFSVAELHALIADTIVPQVPPEHTNVILGTVDPTKAQILVSFKRVAGDRWKLTGSTRHHWNNGARARGVVVLASW